MTKQEIFDAFDGKLSRKNITKVDGEWRLHGKDVEIEYLGDGLWDVYVCNRKDMYSGLGQRRVRNVLRLFSPTPASVTELTGEGFVQGRLEDIKPVILEHRAFLGIRKKREVTGDHMRNFGKKHHG